MKFKFMSLSMCLAVLLALCSVSHSAIAQKTFKMSGTFTDVKNDTLIIDYVAYTPQKVTIKFKVPVDNEGRFSFQKPIEMAYDGGMTLQSNPNESLYFFLVPDEEAIITGAIGDKPNIRWSGSRFYQEYEEALAVIRPYKIEHAQAKAKYEEGVKAGGDEVKLKRELDHTVVDINTRTHKVAYDYAMKHLDREASMMLIFSLGLDDVMDFLNGLTPEVRNGRFKKNIEITEEFYRLVTQRVAAANVVQGKTAKKGKLAPEIELDDLSGKKVTLSSLRGKYVVLDFWGSWCMYCIKGIPRMKDFYAKHSDKVEILSIACNDKETDWRKAVEKYQLPWLQVRSEDGITEARFAVQGYPFKVVISPDGHILQTFVGESDDFYSYMESLLSKQ